MLTEAWVVASYGKWHPKTHRLRLSSPGGGLFLKLLDGVWPRFLHAGASVCATYHLLNHHLHRCANDANLGCFTRGVGIRAAAEVALVVGSVDARICRARHEQNRGRAACRSGRAA